MEQLENSDERKHTFYVFTVYLADNHIVFSDSTFSLYDVRLRFRSLPSLSYYNLENLHIVNTLNSQLQ